MARAIGLTLFILGVVLLLAFGVARGCDETSDSGGVPQEPGEVTEETTAPLERTIEVTEEAQEPLPATGGERR